MPGFKNKQLVSVVSLILILLLDILSEDTCHYTYQFSAFYRAESAAICALCSVIALNP